MGRGRRRGRCTLGCGSLWGCGGRRGGDLAGGWKVGRDGRREVVFGGGRCRTSGDAVGLLRLLSVGAPALGGHRKINGGFRKAICDREKINQSQTRMHTVLLVCGAQLTPGERTVERRTPSRRLDLGAT